jgi:hypothetical protein
LFLTGKIQEQTEIKSYKSLKYNTEPGKTIQLTDPIQLFTDKMLLFIENKAPALWQRLIFHLHEKNCAV